jgi:hypothetical protein
MKLEYIGVHKRKNARHVGIGSKEGFVLLEQWHVFPNTAIGVH